MKKISTVQILGDEIFKEQKLTIGVDLGDRWSFYCVLGEAGKIILEQKVSTTPEAIREVDYQVAASTEREHPPGTERISLRQECGWKDGDRGGLSLMEQTHGKKTVKVCLDISRPSHGRT